MTRATTYVLRTIADLLQIPDDRRDACWIELRLALALHELGVGEHGTIECISWTDDGDSGIDLSINGQQELSMIVTRSASLCRDTREAGT